MALGSAILGSATVGTAVEGPSPDDAYSKNGFYGSDDEAYVKHPWNAVGIMRASVEHRRAC
jgi:hypothetical protein